MDRYVVLSDGRVWSEYKKGYLKPTKVKHQLYVNLHGKNVNLNKLVYIKFQGKVPKNKVISFKNVKNEVASIDNLKLIDRGDNLKQYRTRKPFYAFNIPNTKRKFRVVMKVKGKCKTFGYFKTEEDAIRCYNDLVARGY